MVLGGVVVGWRLPRHDPAAAAAAAVAVVSLFVPRICVFALLPWHSFALLGADLWCLVGSQGQEGQCRGQDHGRGNSPE